MHGEIIGELQGCQVIEPIILHIKRAHRTGRIYLKGNEGGRIKAFPAVA